MAGRHAQAHDQKEGKVELGQRLQATERRLDSVEAQVESLHRIVDQVSTFIQHVTSAAGSVPEAAGAPPGAARPLPEHFPRGGATPARAHDPLPDPDLPDPDLPDAGLPDLPGGVVSFETMSLATVETRKNGSIY